MKSAPVLAPCGSQTARPQAQNGVCRLSLNPTMEIPCTRYSGSSRKLVVALDIGTTFSGAAYALLDPGEVPHIYPISHKVSISIDLWPE